MNNNGHLLKLFALMCLLLLTQACSDTGVTVGGEPLAATDTPVAPDTPGNTTPNDDSSADGAGATQGTGELTEPTNASDPTGDTPVATSVSNLNAEDVEAARFLVQATFGPTPESIAALRDSASLESWIDQQMALPVSLTEPYTRRNSNGSNTAARHEIWWHNAVSEPDQLRQRVAFALSQLFVVSDLAYLLANAQWGMANYYDMLSTNAFGNYRELLEQVTLHPVMGTYLSMVRNEKADPANNIRPDENYAREVLQLFSIGLFELNNRGEALPADNPQPSYTQQTVEDFARVFTGWNYDKVTTWETPNFGNEGVFTNPMVPNEAFHDTGSKTLLNGVVAPAGLSTAADMTFALDNIFQHKNVGVLVSRHLIQQLITSNPSPEYIERMTDIFNNNGNGVRGDLGALVKAILLDVEARDAYLNNPDFGKIREPVIRIAHLWRALDGTPGPLADEGVHNTADFTLVRVDEMTGQAVMNSLSVFNFFKPDHTIIPGGSTRSPEMEIMSEANLASTHINYHHQIYRFNDRSDLSDDNPRVTIIKLEPLAEMARNPDELLDWYNLIFFSGAMPDDMRQTLFTYMRTLDNDDAGRFAKVQDTLFMIMASPQSHIQR